MLSKAADEGDKLADKVWADIGLKIGVGLTNVIWLVNPDRIVIGGGVANAGERLFGYIRQTIRTRCEKTFWEKLEVVPATLGNDAGIIGAAALALESEFRPPRRDKGLKAESSGSTRTREARIFLKQILCHYAVLFSGTKNLGLPDDDLGLLVETIAVATRAGGDSLGNNRVARLTNLIKLRLLGDFRRFRRSLAERHDLISSDLTELHDEF